jgi:hypothetical protein
MTNSAVCTVFEGHYHKGVAALANSLVANGFEGVIWAGYKGNLPAWATIEKQNNDVSEMRVSEKLRIHFVKFDSTVFLPYCKPDFMLDILENKAPTLEKLFFLDCDIIVKCRYSYFEEWAEFGVALCEDVGSPLPVSHPLRFQWKQFFAPHGLTVHNRDHYYVNGGFTGLKRAHKDFLSTWSLVQNLMRSELKELKSVGHKDRTNPFNRTDQDALNIAKDITDLPLSIADGTAMDLSNFGYIMSHAVGQEKPWTKNYLKFVIQHGQRPTMTDKLFMQHTKTPLSIYTNSEFFWKNLNLKMANMFSRVLA